MIKIKLPPMPTMSDIVEGLTASDVCDFEAMLYHAISAWKEVCIKLIEEAAARG